MCSKERIDAALKEYRTMVGYHDSDMIHEAEAFAKAILILHPELREQIREINRNENVLYDMRQGRME